MTIKNKTYTNGQGFTTRYTLPIYWASYLVNSDASGLEDEEQKEIDNWVDNEMEENEYKSFHCIDVSENYYFKYINDANSLGGDVATFTFSIT